MSELVPELNQTDRAILRELAVGARTQGYLIENTSHSRGQIQRSLDGLRMGEYVNRLHKGTALYEITDKGRRKIEGSDDD